jgi:hypothetical protein
MNAAAPLPGSPWDAAESTLRSLLRKVAGTPRDEQVDVLCRDLGTLRPLVVDGYLEPDYLNGRIYDFALGLKLFEPGSESETTIGQAVRDVTMPPGLVEAEQPPGANGPEEFGLPRDGEIVRDLPPAAVQRIAATPFTVRDPATLAVRDILYGRHLIRKYVSGLVGISGGGKSTVSMAETFARVSGKPLLGVPVRTPLRCWSINLEDPRDEIERRAQATCLHYGLTAEDISDRLFLDSGRDQPVVVARTLAGGTKIMEPVVESIIAEIKARDIDVLTIDPFVSSHEVPENDNGAIDLVIKKACRARRLRCGTGASSAQDRRRRAHGGRGARRWRSGGGPEGFARAGRHDKGGGRARQHRESLPIFPGVFGQAQHGAARGQIGLVLPRECRPREWNG